jgi:hypothetical protein
MVKMSLFVITAVLCMSACAGTQYQMSDRSASQSAPDMIIQNDADREIIELQRAYQNKNFSYMRAKLYGYFRVGNTRFLRDVINDSPAMGLRLLSVPVMYQDDYLFNALFPIVIEEETDEPSRRMAAYFKLAYASECPQGLFTSVMRRYMNQRSVHTIDLSGMKYQCTEVIRTIY